MFSTIDVRFRSMADYVVLAQNDKINQKFYYHVYGKNLNSLFTTRANEFAKLQTLSISHDRAKKYFNAYNTLQIIKSIQINDAEPALHDVETIKLKTNEYVNKFLSDTEANNAKDVTKDKVKVWAFDNNVPKFYVERIYLKIKEKLKTTRVRKLKK